MNVHRERAKALLDLALKRLERDDDQGALRYIYQARSALTIQSPVEIEFNPEKRDVTELVNA